MRRADRLFRIVQMLRRERATTAAKLADELEVSERTVYRDVQDLVQSGVPIQGEAGVGYALPTHFDLPPLMFTAAELEALVLGARMVQGWADDDLAKAARSSLAKIEHVLPPGLRHRLDDSRLFVPDFHVDRSHREHLRILREQVDRRQVVHLRYIDEDGSSTVRDVRPLALSYWGRTWTLVAWCEMRRDFRSFRLDRVDSVQPTGRRFVDEPGRTLADFLARVQREEQVAPASQAPPRRTPAAPSPARATRKGRPGTGAPADPAARAAWRAFQRLGSIGPAGAHDLLVLGFRDPEQLRGQDPRVLYQRLCELTGQRHDPCVEDALRCAVAQVDDPDLPAAWRQWHLWTPLRGQPPSARPGRRATARRRRD